ncbi:DgyrCDS11424 [Dimorphilus gyrociliatus]|uniref:DgyrCDS11424 n=1 Tax=Dimorphilus gyrociliatus TaxID=2664684 RepID=A0A7I8W4L1_9ANNE|nr:DgyrCDS11424 [Dimorphilus gyrociliatus]
MDTKSGELNFTDQYPLIVCLKKDSSRYAGYLRYDDHEIFIDLKKPTDLDKTSWFKCDNIKLRKLTSNIRESLNEESILDNIIHHFYNESKSVINQNSFKDGLHFKNYKRLVDEMAEIGWNRIQYVDADLKEIHLRGIDEADRNHLFKINLDNEYPRVAPIVICSLPEKFDFKWIPEKSKILDIFNEFEESLKKYQYLWKIFDELEEETWVIQPDSSLKYKETFRQIYIEQSVSMTITVDVRCPQSLPTLKFLGPTKDAMKYEKFLHENAHLWNCEESLVSNLESIFEMKFKKRDENPDSSQPECGICLLFNHPESEKIPDTVCQSCQQTYHSACLVKWLYTRPDTRKSMKLVFGKCCLCKKPITVNIQ